MENSPNIINKAQYNRSVSHSIRFEIIFFNFFS